MGTWSLRNHRALNGKSLSSSAEPSSSATGRPRRQGVKVDLLCVLRVCVCVPAVCDMLCKSVAHIHWSTRWDDTGALTHTRDSEKQKSLTPTRAQSRRHIVTYECGALCGLAYAHSKKRDFPINHQQQYYPAIQCRAVIDEAEGGPDSRGSRRSSSQCEARVE